MFHRWDGLTQKKSLNISLFHIQGGCVNVVKKCLRATDEITGDNCFPPFDDDVVNTLDSAEVGPSTLAVVNIDAGPTTTTGW